MRSSRATRSGSRTGAGSPAVAARSRTRFASTPNGPPCGDIARSGGSGCSATSRSTWRRGASITALTRSCSRTGSSRVPRRTHFPTTVSCGATRCTTGRRCADAATGGGSSGRGGPWSCSTSPGSITSGGLSRTGRWLRVLATAVDGRWVRGPGRAVFDAIAAGLGGALPFVAEDLGVITPPVDRLRDALGLPGMVVLQFGFEPDVPGSVHRLANHLSHRFVYTGTHDHDTARGWWEGLDSARRARARRSARVRAQRVDVGARARAVVGADPARAVLAGVRRDDADAGCPRARLRGADEQPGAPGRPVALADGVRVP